MSDIFKALANPKARLVLETLAKTPSSTASKLAETSKVSSEQATAQLTVLVEAGLVRATGSGASKKYSINAKGFKPYLTWFAKSVPMLTLILRNLESSLAGCWRM
jgi:DNA-binding transcriptional ArsR family regulator